MPGPSSLLRGTVAVLAACLAACATSPARTSGSGSPGATGSRLPVAASINVWGSLLAQLGGDRVQETSVISNPDTDPHDYEPTPADGRIVADSRLFIENGIGYDSWAAKSVAASPDPQRQLIDVGRLVGVGDGGNPHRWYSPTDVERVAAAITASLKRLDSGDSAYFDRQLRAFSTTGLASYHRLISDVRTRYPGVAVGASESIFQPLADALDLRLLTPSGFLKAISEGTDPSAADKAEADAQLTGRQVEVYVFNSQNSTPDVAAQVDAARRTGIPVATMTETLTPIGASFQDWQVAQLRALESALRQATGR